MGAKLIPGRETEIGELDFGFDGFQNQKVLRGIYAYARLADRLIRKRKGTNPSEPDMGIDLDSYRFSDITMLVAGSLRNVIQNQLMTYIPNMPLQSVDVSTMKVRNDYVLYITIGLLNYNNAQIELSYMQRKRSIISTKINVETPKLIGAQKS